ncbi:hypothetical protein D7Z26_10255 [Cohnella endophytica]|uniref:Uncharacterized protein n=1 Tax=Cohnella endophytica TaxID=2419778 RepID=A0A494Y5G3_9BACL|nr:hypothetical protein D7Z26_10255 [Cohnella endophytica]
MKLQKCFKKSINLKSGVNMQINSRFVVITIIILILFTGCNSNQRQLTETTRTVIGKEEMNGKYILEISSIKGSEKKEIEKEYWETIRSYDLVTFNNKGQLIRINNEPIHE